MSSARMSLRNVPSWVRRRRARIVGGLGMLGFFAILQQMIRQPKVFFVENPDIMIPLQSKHKNQEEYIDRRGIHVVVGHYLGDDIPGKPSPNLTKEILNMNSYSPQPGAGEKGIPVQVPAWESAKMQLLFHVNKFNLLASDRISVNRSLPDVRKKACKKNHYSLSHLPTTSVIIVFHNEAWSTLLRTLHSVINRSPHQLLKEIVLVDDASDRVFLKKPLDDYVAKLVVAVRVVRVANRTGLIRARLLGAQAATGAVLTFLDAHCEATEGWLEPLLSRVGEDRTRVVSPIIDIIHDDTFQYVRSLELHWGAFNWNLHFRWFSMSHEQIERRMKNVTEAYRTPAMAGGLFSINKRFFYEIGAYDRQMEIWGGENLELSFRVWMCGGSVEIVPCSHVGHVFRRSSPYTFPGEGGVGGILYRNLARLALVWMDEWSSFYFKMNPEAETAKRDADVSDRKLLRKRLNCHTFEWYLSSVWKEHFFPVHGAFFGKIRNKYQSRCIQRPQSNQGSSSSSGPAVLKDCVFETYPPQSFVFNKQGFILTDENICLDAPDSQTSDAPQVSFMPFNQYKRQKWSYDEKSSHIVHVQTGLCLDLPDKSHPDTLSIRKCSGWSRGQKWLFQSEEWTTV